MPPSVDVRFSESDFSVTDISSDRWSGARPAVLDRSWNGEPATSGRRCEARLLWSDNALHIRFHGAQTEPFVLFDNPDVSRKRIGLWDRDVCEVFITPDPPDRRRYMEFEVAPTGEWLDLVVDWTLDEPRDWEFDSGMAVFSEMEDGSVTMAIRIPWGAFGRKPSAGDVWFGNLFRQIGSGETRGYLAWSPTMTPEPQFHVPEKFGAFVFVR